MMSQHASPAMQQAATSVPTERGPDPDSPLRRPSDDPTLGDGAKPPTTLGWLPTLSLTDRRALDAPAYVYESELGARIARALESLDRPVATVTPAQPGRPARPATPGGHPLVLHIASAPALDPATAASVDATVRAYGPGATVVSSGERADHRAGAPEEVSDRVGSLGARGGGVGVTAAGAEGRDPGLAAQGGAGGGVGSGPGGASVTAGEGPWAANAVGAVAAAPRAG